MALEGLSCGFLEGISDLVSEERADYFIADWEAKRKENIVSPFSPLLTVVQACSPQLGWPFLFQSAVETSQIPRLSSPVSSVKLTLKTGHRRQCHFHVMPRHITLNHYTLQLKIPKDLKNGSRFGFFKVFLRFM